MKNYTEDQWNRMVRLRDKLEKDSETYKMACLLLGQMDTASGRRMKDEVAFFLQQNETQP